MGLIIIAITFSVERYLSINKARGKGEVSAYIKRVLEHLRNGKYDDALKECEKQRGSLASIMRAAVVRFRDVEKDPILIKKKP